VFVTPEGDCRGLYVRRKSNSFEVRELTAGKSSIAFSYRIVGKRRDIVQHRRFSKIDMRAPLLAAEIRTKRKPPPTPVRLREFIARARKEAAAQRPSGPEKGRRPRALGRLAE